MTTQNSTRSFRPKCAVCGSETSRIDLTEKRNGWHMKYKGAGGENGSGDLITAERAQNILTAFAEPYAPDRIRAAGFYDDGGYCLDCQQFYCPTHWNITSTGGGRCPKGHFKSLDPHWSPE